MDVLLPGFPVLCVCGVRAGLKGLAKERKWVQGEASGEEDV